MYFLLSFYTYFLFLIVSIVCIVIAVIIRVTTKPFDKNLKILHQFSCFWASVYIYTNPLWRVKILKSFEIPKDKAYVMVSNHQSMLDILVIYQLFNHFKWVSKKEVFKAPFIGWNMQMNEYISVDRSNKKTHVKFLTDCVSNLERGNSIMVFPEGTRSLDGGLLMFKDGPFRIALAAKTDILPIVLDGTAKLLPKTGYIFKAKGVIEMKVLEPIPYESFCDKTSKEIAQMVQDKISEELHKIRNKA